jgi:hypothetical protein
MAIKRNINATTALSVLTFFAFCLTAHGAEKDIIDGDISDNYINSTVIARAPKDSNFESLDTDNDGKISLQEAINEISLAENFNNTDVNHDGVITVDEYAMFVKTNEEQTDIN